MARSPQKRIALAQLQSAIDTVRGRPPPTVDLDMALKLIGPDLRRMLKEGWGDDDIVAAFLEVDDSAAPRHDNTASGEKPILALDREGLFALLAQLRSKEAEARSKRERQSREPAEKKRTRQGSKVLSEVKSEASPLLSLSNHAQTTAQSPKLLAPPSPNRTPDRNEGID